MGCRGRARHRDPVHAGPRRDAGLHRRALHRRPRHDARGRRRPRRRPEARSTRSRRPRWSSTTRSSPTCSAPRTPSSATSRSSTSATASATSSCAGARRPSTTSRSSRRAPASCTRSTSSTSPRSSTTATVGGVLRAYPDTCVGTDSHTTMVNGLGVLGWGVGGIEAEAAMLGQPVSMLIPKVVGFKLSGAIPTGVTATDVVLTITEMLRKHGVVGKFVEFYGEGVASVPLANRATIGNMSPEFGSTAAMFPIDERHARLPAPHRSQRASSSRWSRRTRRRRRCGTTPRREPVFSEYLELDLVDGRPLDRRPEAPAGPHRAVEREDRSSRATSPTTPTSSTTWSISRAPSRSRHPTRPGNSPDDEYSAHTAPPPQPRARASGSKPTPVVARGRREVHARPRRRHDRRDHVVHEHVEPLGHARRRPAGPQRGEEGPEGQAVGQDHPRARARRSSPTTTRRPA